MTYEKWFEGNTPQEIDEQIKKVMNTKGITPTKIINFGLQLKEGGAPYTSLVIFEKEKK